MPVSDKPKKKYKPKRRVVLYPYKMASASVNALAASLSAAGVDVLKVYPDRNFKPTKSDFVINWGSSVKPKWDPKGALALCNQVDAVNLAGNKLRAFGAMQLHGTATPDFTDNQQRAQTWVNNGTTVVVRHLLRGHSGAGIELVGASIDNGELTGIVPEAPLYTTYVKKALEYRVHVFDGKVIHWQQKMLRRDFEGEPNYQVRNHANGWIYAHETATNPPNPVRTHAVHAVNSLGLMFGAVDVVYNKYKKHAVVLEVNTAPGLEGTTVEVYRDAIKRAISNV